MQHQRREAVRAAAFLDVEQMAVPDVEQVTAKGGRVGEHCRMVAKRAAPSIHENHEMRFMTKGVERMAHCAQHALRNDCSRSRKPALRHATQGDDYAMDYPDRHGFPFRLRNHDVRRRALIPAPGANALAHPRAFVFL